jgi:hypothetical protein
MGGIVQGIECLREAISTVPVPGAPPSLSREGAVVGLAFLDIALRLNHIRRLTERLAVAEHGIARRTTEVDISLNMLDTGQREAARLFKQLASRGFDDRANGPIRDAAMWVPVARISRSMAEPVDVRNAEGDKVPRLTQHETSRLLASGLYRLLRQSLTGHSDSVNQDSDLHQVLFKIHEPRWLIQYALLTLFSERHRPDEKSIWDRTPGTVEGHGRQYRKLALEILDSYADYLREYSLLLDIAVNHHLLVVALDSRSDEHILTYDSPLYVNEQSSPFKRLWRTLRASGEGYYMQYHTGIPSTLRSYHLVVEAAADVDVSRMYLKTDADAKIVRSLTSDLRFLAESLKSQKEMPMGEPAKKQLELESQIALRTLAELVRRRMWEASHAHITLSKDGLSASLRLAQAAISGEATRNPQGEISNSLINHPYVSPENLWAAAEELEREEMSYDLSLENDPTTSRAHAYWRTAPQRPANSSQIEILAGAILRDATQAGPRSVFSYALALSGISYIVAAFITRSAWPYGAGSRAFGHIENVEGVIAVLLLVPGFLYTRLTLPDPHSVSGHLRAVPRFVAQFCIFAMVTLSATIAAGSKGWIVHLAFSLATLLPLCTSIFLFRRQPYRHEVALARLDAPKWAVGQKRIMRRAVIPDVLYSSWGRDYKLAHPGRSGSHR